MRVTVACARCRHVNGEHQGSHPGGLRPLQGVAHETAIASTYSWNQIGCGLCDATSSIEHTDTVDRQKGMFCWPPPGRLHFTASRVHAGQADRAEDHRHRQFGAEQLGGKTQVVDIAQDALAQADLGQVRTVGAQRVLGVGAAVDVIEQKRGNLRLARRGSRKRTR